MEIMYRTETYSGSLERCFTYVLQYEVFVLHIFDELIQNELVGSAALTAQMKSMVNELDENGYVEDMSEYDQLEFLEQLRMEISSQVNKDIQYALWLADWTCVQKFYGGTDSDIEGYEISDVVLSDLGNSGILFGYVSEPYPVIY